jgi:hypothetical protein
LNAKPQNAIGERRCPCKAGKGDSGPAVFDQPTPTVRKDVRSHERGFSEMASRAFGPMAPYFIPEKSSLSLSG